MKTHEQIDERSRALAYEIVKRIDGDPGHAGLSHAREVCQRWLVSRRERINTEWWMILQKPWEDIRTILLDMSEEGKRLRQSSPFCGILSPKERLEVFKRFRE